MEQLHQEAQLNLQSLLQEEYEEQYESRVTGQTFRAAGHPSPSTPTEPSPRPPPSKRLEFVLMPPSRRANDEESSGATALGVRPPDASLSLPTTPDKQTAWPRAFPLPTVEEKQWHQSCSVQTNVVPINVSGRAAGPGAGKCCSQGDAGWWEGKLGLQARVPASPVRTIGDSSATLVCVIPCHLSCHLQLCSSDPPATLPSGLSFLPRCPTSRFCCHLGSHHAPSVHPSICLSSWGCSSQQRRAARPLQTSHGHVKALGPAAEREAPRESKRCHPALSLRDAETCRHPCCYSRPSVTHACVPSVSQQPGPISDEVQRCGVPPHQHQPEPVAQSGACLRRSLCIPPPSAASPCSHQLAPPSPPCLHPHRSSHRVAHRAPSSPPPPTSKPGDARGGRGGRVLPVAAMALGCVHSVFVLATGQHFARHASARHSLFNTETAMNPKSTLRRRRTIIGFPNMSLRDQGSVNANGPATTTRPPITESLSCSFEPASGGKPAQEISPRQPLSAPLRKTFSDLGGTLQARCCPPSTPMDNMATPGTCNGPQGTPFPSPWGASSFSYAGPPSPTAGQGASPGSSGMGSPAGTDRAASFFIAQEERVGSAGPGSFTAAVPESPPGSGGLRRCDGREARVNFSPTSKEEPEPASEPARLGVERAGCRFRERSLSVPTDSGSLCSVDIAYAEARRGSTNCALGYPSAGSEGSTSTDNISLGPEPDGQRRRRSKSISLKKAKKKPSPPTRSVSLIKDGQDGPAALGLPRDQRPKSLCIPLDPPSHRLVHADPQGREPDGPAAPHQWYLADWKTGDPYRSLSGSSTATGTTAVECVKARGSSESLTSPSISRATTPSQLSAEADLKTSSPGRPTGLMSPSSGYSSQSETPTPTVPTSAILGHSPHQVRVRPLVPERKSSLPPTSPMERSPKSRLSFDLPLTPPAHLDLSGLKISLKGKTKVSRHHSDSTFGTKLAQKTSPIQPIMPVVTQSDLRSVRLRSISRSEPEDNADGLEHAEDPPRVPCPGPERKVKPPVAEKPPLAKRPPSILPKPLALREEGPLSPTSPPSIATRDGLAVLRKGEPRRGPGEPRRLSQGSLEDEPRPEGERRKAKVPPPVPKKPSVLYLPLAPAPVQQGGGAGDPAPTPSPIITLDTEPSCCHPDTDDPMPTEVPGTAQAGETPLEQGSLSEAGTEEKSFASDKTADSIAEEDDDVFVASRTTEDLFTVIHRSKRKVLGRKEPGDTFGSRPNSHSPVKTSGSPTSESPAAVVSTGKSSSRNEDFKALLQKKSSKTSAGTRPSAAELLKTTNPLARRVMTEFAPELDGANSPKSQP
ncbi:NHS-like protein 2 isoform X1 [Cygnus olor]|uniref:NHS-like protein 2 isoform X1 n=1 Tax=Cygnus olor TaxID=8869 RepID=UPI001ADEAEFD|nr:NHS-like protein 2 isoform X1 [Cygnus olor]